MCLYHTEMYLLLNVKLSSQKREESRHINIEFGIFTNFSVGNINVYDLCL